ncbi:NfeD family protein [Thalassoroseus pseudoceratinae]|uniref:NfeD family protein n=1 Tax=Thalassoroseus pseudoceratinae TaxID=2713176 RepID=UPI00141D8E8D|nr:NfeD family protein [Thalassoroseus pseudoceratinae]
MDSTALTALALFGLAAVFVLLEMLFGTDGSLLILAGVSGIGGFVFMLRSTWLPREIAWWAYPALAVGGIILASIVAVYLFPHSAIGENLLGEPEPGDVTPFAPDDGERLQYIGRRGKTLTVMNPGGLVLLDGKREHAETEGVVIEPGETIEVIELRGQRFVVRSVRDTASATPPPTLDETQNRTV